MMSGRRSTCTHNAAHHVLHPHYTHAHAHAHPHHTCLDQVMTTVVARSDCKVSASFMCVHAWWHMIYGRWGCIDCRYVSVCMYASMRAWSMREFVWMRHLLPSQLILNMFWYLKCLCMCEQLWVLPFTNVNKIVKKDKHACEHLEKVRVHKHGEIVRYKRTKRTIASLKYPFTTFIFTLFMNTHTHTHTHTYWDQGNFHLRIKYATKYFLLFSLWGNTHTHAYIQTCIWHPPL